MLIFENKVKLAELPGGLEGAFGTERHNSPDSFFLKTHLTIQAAAEVSGYNAQYIRWLLRAGKLNGDNIGQV